MPEPKRELVGTKLDTVEVEMGEGKTFAANVTSILRTTAKEVFGDKAKGENREVLVITYEGDEGIAGQATISYRRIPTAKSHLRTWARKWGAPSKGQSIQVRMDENGYWRPDL